jgi:biotin synthase
VNRGKKIYLCAINNVLSGSCSEDCRFCSQSARYRADIDRYGFKSLDTVLHEASIAISNGAVGYCLVTAGRSLDDRKCEYLSRTAKELKKRFPSLWLIGCNGTADEESLRHLAESGIDSYNHNLESSEGYYPQICTTHSWSERYSTCEAVKRAGLMLCCGGIFGMGESRKDREELIEAIASLRPEAVPVNFFIPNPSLPIGERNIDSDEALRMIESVSRKVSPSILMVAGGRESLLSGREEEMYRAGCNSIVIGDYLTTRGEKAERDRAAIANLGYEIADSCS